MNGRQSPSGARSSRTSNEPDLKWVVSEPKRRASQSVPASRISRAADLTIELKTSARKRAPIVSPPGGVDGRSRRSASQCARSVPVDGDIARDPVEDL